MVRWSGRDPHAAAGQVGDGSLDAGDLQGYRMHASPKSLDKAGRPAVRDGGLTDLDGVVADPGHTPSSPHRWMVPFGVFHYSQPS